MAFESNIIKWINIDDQITILNNKVKSLREEKSNISNDITNYIIDNSLENKIFKLTDSNTNIQYIQSNTYSSLTYKYLHTSFLEYFKDNDYTEPEVHADMLLDYIKSNRTVIEKNTLKRN